MSTAPALAAQWFVVEAPDQVPPYFLTDGYDGPVLGRFPHFAEATLIAKAHSDAINALRPA